MIALIVFALSVTTGFFAWLVRELMEIKLHVSEVTSQVQNNGGATMRDTVDRIERKLDLHLSWHAER